MALSITVIIILVNVVISFIAFQDVKISYRLCFWPYRIWHDKEWSRILSGAFIHANVPHIVFNMFSLFFFGPVVEDYFMLEFGSIGHAMYIVFYILAAVVANIPDLYQHRDDPSYRAVGASGAVAAVIFASILFNPLTGIYIMLVPLAIPAYVFGAFYLAYSAYMSRRGGDGIGHLAHFSGALFGFVFPLIFAPGLFIDFVHKIFR